MEKNQKILYQAPETTILEIQGESCMVPSSWGHEEG